MIGFNKLNPRNMRMCLAMLVGFALALLAAGWFWQSGSTDIALAKAEHAEFAELNELASMAVESGEISAEEAALFQQQNLLIPISDAPLETPGAGFRLSMDNSAYKSALQCMTEAVYYEAANEIAQGKRAVAQVILNRMKHPAYPSSVCGVVYEGSNKRVCQFSFTCDGSMLRKPMARQWSSSRAVAAASLSGFVEKSVGTATHYHADYVLPYWAHRLAKVEVVGAHIFYRFNGRWGGSGAFSKKWSGREAKPQIDFARFEGMTEGEDITLAEIEIETVPGLTVTPDVTDRHATSDVGGRVDTTKGWRPNIPDPATSNSAYQSALDQQGERVDAEARRDAKAEGTNPAISR